MSIESLPQMSDDVRKLNPQLSIPESPDNSKPPSKYKNVRTEFKGMTFSSGREAKAIHDLILLEEQHRIFGLRLQVRFPLPGDVVYVADAVYVEYDEKIKQFILRVVDAKGMQTPEFKLKRKLFREKYGQDIELV